MRIFMDRFRKNFSDCFSIIVIAAVILCFILMKDTGTTAALCWLAVVFSVSFFMRPYLPFKTLRFPDAGFALTFGAGLFLCFYAAWIFSALTGLEFADATAYGSLVILAAAGYVIRRYVRGENYITVPEFKKLLNGFALFALVFLAFFWVIGFNPLTDPGTENYMDFGFMQTIYRQKSAIPMDPWFSGTKLNYYYLGQAASVYMTRLAHTTPEFGYNMMLATFSGMVFVMVFELVTGIAGALFADREKNGKRIACGGLLGGCVAAFGGNPHWILYGVIARFMARIMGTGKPGYWFSDGTAYIGRQFGDPDNGKNEFPAYSVILGDLHAHVINVIFVLPLLALLFDICMDEDKEEDKKSVIYKLVLISLLLSYYKGANYWDFAIYYVITGALIVFADIKKRGLSLKTLAAIAFKACLVTVVSVVAILPFTLNFVKMESGVAFCENHSPAGKLFVLWFIPVAVSVALILWLYTKPEGLVSNVTGRCALFALVLCTMGLVITPEVVYVRDIYGDDNQRFNTMFKLTYQAFILFALIIGIAFAAALIRSYYATAVAFIIVAVLDVSYTPYACHQWMGDWWDADKRSGISSLAGLYGDETYGFEMEALDVLKEDDRRIINIVEMCGNSYKHESSLSVYSGACTPVGWFVHEWMWHNDPEPVRERADEVSYFYRCGDEDYCRDFIERYDIDYIFVGPGEVVKYAVDREGFRNLGQTVACTIWKDCELELIKVDRTR